MDLGHHFSRALAVLSLAFAVSLVACEDEDDVVVREPPRLSNARVQGLMGSGMMIHAAMSPGLCFDAAHDRADPRTPVHLFGCHGRENQRWTFSPASRGAVAITGIAGMCLDIHAVRSENASAQLYPCNGGGNQQYAFLSDGRLRELATGRCLTAAGMEQGAPIVLAPCDARIQEQVWTIADR